MQKSVLLAIVFFACFAFFVGSMHAGDATLTLDDNAGSSAFVVQDSDKTNQFKINSDGQGYFAGKVGIGTTGPTALLDVSSGTNNGVRINAASGYAALIFANSGTNKWIQYPDGDDMLFLDVAGGYANRVIFKSGGNVGIGTTNPGSKLTVVGTIESTSGGVKFPDGTTQTTAASGQASIADSSVTTAKLKTATGEVSVAAGVVTIQVLPGGEYGFYPQFKAATAGGVFGASFAQNAWNPTESTTYTTYINIYNASYTNYAQQRYVTASGKDHWLFLLLNKNTKDIVGAYSAPDHPSYGNGGDPDKVQHPFGSYDPEKHEIVIVDNETIKQLKQESSSTGKSLLTLVNEEYKINKKKAEPYVPLHSGKFLTQDGKQTMQMIEILPDYIKVRKLEKFNASEKSEREADREAALEAYENAKQKKERTRAKVLGKLKALGLAENEIMELLN